jgi:hypothetical protein
MAMWVEVSKSAAAPEKALQGNFTKPRQLF